MPRARASRRGFTLVELVVVICLVALLASLAAKRLLALRVEAERAAFGQVVGSLQAATTFELLARLTAGREAEIGGLAGGNPMEWLLDTPGTYVGALRGADPASVRGGLWFFDADQGLLIYRVRHADRFESELPGPARARFRVEIVYDDRDGDGRYDPGLDGVGGARLRPAERFAWRDAPGGAAPR